MKEAALRFRNNVLSLDAADHVVRRIYDELKRDSRGCGATRNGVAGYLHVELIARDAKWEQSVGVSAAKTKGRAFVKEKQNDDLVRDLKDDRSTLRDMRRWVQVDRHGIPAYRFEEELPCWLARWEAIEDEIPSRPTPAAEQSGVHGSDQGQNVQMLQPEGPRDCDACDVGL